MILTHLRHNVVAYLALLVALTGTSYAAVQIKDGSVTTRKLHTSAVTSSKIRNGTITLKDLDAKQGMDYLQTLTSGDTPVSQPDLVSVAPYDFSLPRTGKAYVSVFLPALGADACGGGVQPTVGLYIDNSGIPTTKSTVPAVPNARPLMISVSYPLKKGAHAARLGITCSGSGVPSGIVAPGTHTWTVGLIGE